MLFNQRRIAYITLGAAFAGVYLCFYRPWHSRWGATDEEVAASMPGDELIKQPTFNVTRAATVRARPREIWPWIAQIGFGRAGFYSYDLLDNLGKPSAKRIIPELQHIEVGTWIPMSRKVSQETAFQVKALEINQWMLWEKAASTWSWKLVSLDGDYTRLIVRLRCRYRWSKPTIVTDLLLMELGDFPMMRKMLLGIKRRAEGSSIETTEPAVTRVGPFHPFFLTNDHSCQP